MKINDCHIHAGGKNYVPKRFHYNSSIDDYLEKTEELRVDKKVFFAQPEPYEWLIDYFPKCPTIDYSEKNDEIGRKCLKYDDCLFSVFVDHADYNAYEEIERCVNFYDARAVKVHFNCKDINPIILEKYNIIKSAGNHGLNLIIHPSDSYSKNFEEVVKRNKDVNFIIAHLGFLEENNVNTVINNDNAYFDTSAFIHQNFKDKIYGLKIYDKIAGLLGKEVKSVIHSYFQELVNVKKVSRYELEKGVSEPELFLRLLCSVDSEKLIETVVEELGSHNILFGSDESWSPVKEQIDIIKNTNISSEDKNNIFYRNFEKIWD